MIEASKKIAVHVKQRRAWRLQCTKLIDLSEGRDRSPVPFGDMAQTTQNLLHVDLQGSSCGYDLDCELCVVGLFAT